MKQASHLLKYDSTLGTFSADVQCAPPPCVMRLCWRGARMHAEPPNYKNPLGCTQLPAQSRACCGRTVDESHITVNGKSIRIVSSRDPLQLPWKEEVRQGVESLMHFCPQESV